MVVVSMHINQSISSLKIFIMKNFPSILVLLVMGLSFLVACQKESLSPELVNDKGSPAPLETRSDNNFAAPLSGANEVPPNESDAHGVIIVKIAPDESSIDYKLIVSNADNVVAAHFHLAPEGVNGPVVAHLFGGPVVESQNGLLSEGTITAANVVGPLAGNLQALIDTLRSGYIYTNVHTLVLPGGEIRGQVD